MSYSNFQLNSKVNYLNYAIQQIEANEGIQTINNISDDVSKNFNINAGTNISITPGTNSISIASESDAIKTINNISYDVSNDFSINAGNNIVITSGTNSISIASVNDPIASNFIVDPNGRGNYLTIQAAIDAAVLIASLATPQTILIYPGDYTENISLSSSINLTSLASGVKIIGLITYTNLTSFNLCRISNIRFVSSGGDLFTESNLAYYSEIYFTNCEFWLFGGHGINLNSWTFVGFTNCYMYGIANYSIFNLNTGYIYFYSGRIYSHASAPPSSLNGGSLYMFFNLIYDHFLLTNNGFMLAYSNWFEALNSSPIFTINASGMYCYNSTVVQGAGDYWATSVSSGALNYSNISLVNNLAKIHSSVYVPVSPPVFVHSLTFDGGETSWVAPKVFNVTASLNSVAHNSWVNDILITLPKSNCYWMVEYSIKTNYAVNMAFATIQPALYDTGRITSNIFNSSSNSVSSISDSSFVATFHFTDYFDLRANANTSFNLQWLQRNNTSVSVNLTYQITFTQIFI